MKIFWVILLTLGIVGCTDSRKSNSVEKLEAKSGVIEGVGNFGSFTNTANSKLVTFTVKNDGTESLQGPATLGETEVGFSLTYTNCPNVLSVKKTCLVKVAFDPRNQPLGIKSTTLNFDTLSVNLTATRAEPTPEMNNPQVDIVSSLGDNVDFGTMLSTGSSILKTITLTNNTGSVLTGSVDTTNMAPFSLTYDSCSNKNVAKKATCVIKISLSPKNLSGVFNNSVSINGKTITLQAEVVSPVANLVAYIGSVPVVGPYSFNPVGDKESKQLILTIKNSGTVASIPAQVSLTDDENFVRIFDSCSGNSVAVNGSCQIRVTYSNSGKTPGDYESVLTIGNVSISLSATKEAPAEKLSIDPILAWDSSLISGGVIPWGNLNFSDYDTANWKNTINFNYSDLVGGKILDLRFLPTCDSNCVANLNKWLSVTEFKLSNYTPSGTTPPVILASDMTGKYKNVAVKVTGTNQGESVILDLFNPNSRFNFVGGGSWYNLNPIPNSVDAPGGLNQDSIEFRRPVVAHINTPINLSNNKETLELKNASGVTTGYFKDMDTVRLGRYSVLYMNGGSIDPLVNSFDAPKIFNLNLSDKNMPNKKMWLTVNHKTQVNASFENSASNSVIANPSLAQYGEFGGAYSIVLRYFNSALLKPGPDIDPTYGNPEISFNLKQFKSSCGTPGAGSSELEIVRGKAGKEQLTDHLCGTRTVETILENSETLMATISASSTTPMKALGLRFYAGNNGGANAKMMLHIPTTSEVIPDSPNYVYTGTCGTRIVNHKYEGFIKTNSCVGNRNAVGVDANPNDVPLRKYNGIKRVRIYDSAANKNNWRFHCSWDGNDVAVKLKNTVTNKEMRFYHLSRYADEVNFIDKYGHCGGIIKGINPNYENSPAADYTSCSIDQAINTPNNCVQDGLGQNGFFEVEFVDTATSSETLESYVGR